MNCNDNEFVFVLSYNNSFTINLFFNLLYNSFRKKKKKC